MNKSNTNRMVKVSLLTAISVVLMYLDFPILPMFPWLKMDLSEIPALMGGFAYGPIVGAVIVIIKVFLRLLIKGSSTGLVGELANIIVGVSIVVPASYIYHRNKSKKTAIVGMFVGALIMQISAIFTNVYIFLPLFNMNLKGVELVNYILIGIVPFNAIKAFIVSIGTYLLYKRVSISIFKVDHNFTKKKKQIV